MNRAEEQIKQILEKRSHYGTVKIKKRKISKDITWVGANGYTASVGQWIRTIDNLLKKGHRPLRAFRWFCHVNDDGEPKQRMWYYGVAFPKEDWYHIYACGGTTDYSGEGGRGKEIAETYLRQILPKNLILTRCADYLISELTNDA